ncbi:hypothetical protein SARC_04851 [Sphaeroforma arctica JP610]|uniref:C3H1-type domain-containing protein n=1 Tax=Sphaeroforma arctica JP610 TaxID=667725 RepID=A0A0L0G156_9EUKA|nr:hypothetical protein SARC_04851 [Sphaeroforma arctica JP610]KNC82872.1 hypothetical protein SARC_04851 [Sphaeroforma arctica JP610]|eukprot:XP_014156774.1 hypothetical protein SARC_04851 [Sphaeroforma arctica JP610]
MFPAPFQPTKDGAVPDSSAWSGVPTAAPRWLTAGQSQMFHYQPQSLYSSGNYGNQVQQHGSHGYNNGNRQNMSGQYMGPGGRGGRGGRGAYGGGGRSKELTFDDALNGLKGGSHTWECKNCDKTFVQESQLESHLKQHVSCEHDGCEFSAAKKVVVVHRETVHGKESGPPSVAVPSLDTPEEIEAWREARRRNWQTKIGSKRKLEQDTSASSKRQNVNGNALAALSGYASGSDSNEETKAKDDKKKRVCKYFNGKRGCNKGDKCPLLHQAKKNKPGQKNRVVIKGSLFERLGGVVGPQQQQYTELIQCIRHIVTNGFLQ